MEFKSIEFNTEFANKYWDGPSNFFVRQMNFLRRGMAMFNEWKNYLLLIFGTYWTVKTMDIWAKFNISDVWLMIGLGVIASVGVGCLLLIGRWDLYKAQKATEYINAMHGSITGYNSYNMTVEMLGTLKEILKELKHNEIDITE